MDKPVRKKNRLANFDYSRNGAYFITLCTENKQCIFWNKCVKKPVLSSCGRIVKSELEKIGNIYSDLVIINKYVIMPNHLHLIIFIRGECVSSESGRTQFAPTISRIMKQFKGSVTKQIGFPIWQKSFYDRIIRNEKEYAACWDYIQYNPINWENDELYKNTLKLI